MPELTDDEYQTRREAELRWESHHRDHKEHDAVHGLAHEAHDQKHQAEGAAITTALSAVNRERSIHADAHDREHVSHQREHGLNNLAIDKAESANDKRFQSANAYREQIDALVRNLATKEAVDALNKEWNRRFEDFGKVQVSLRETDVRSEGRGLGQGATVAWIVTAIGLMGGLLGIIIVLSNVLTGTP